MYYIIALLIVLANLFFMISLMSLSIPSLKGNRDLKEMVKNHNPEKNAKLAKIIGIINFVYSLLGMILISISSSLLTKKLEASSLTEEYISWAEDMVLGYGKYVVVFFCFIFFISVISFFISKKTNIIRAALVLASSIIVLISGILYSYIASNDTASLSAYVHFISIGTSAAMVIPYAFELLLRNITCSKKEK